jgi:hypothetical protein
LTDKESDNDNYDPFSDPVYMALFLLTAALASSAAALPDLLLI